MKWKFGNDRPIYVQIVEHMKKSIVTGEYAPGSALPSVRELAMQAEVNPNTMQRALAELENNGLIYTNRTAGKFVTGDGKMIENLKIMMAEEHISRFLSQMESLGFTRNDCIKLIQGGDRKDGLIYPKEAVMTVHEETAKEDVQ